MRSGTDIRVWEKLIAYEAESNVYVVDLTTGREEYVFHNRRNDMETGYFGYSHVSISSRYVVVRRANTEPFITQVVAKPLDNLSGTEIVLDADVVQGKSGALDVYEEWVVWSRERTSTGVYEIVVHNIETDENRILDSSDQGCGLVRDRVWGNRVVWVTGCGEIKAQDLVTRDPIET